MSELRPAWVVFVLLTLLTGIVYPMVVTGIAQVAFDRQANGSLITAGDRIVGSDLIGQPFSSAKYFWGRPSGSLP